MLTTLILTIISTIIISLITLIILYFVLKTDNDNKEEDEQRSDVNEVKDEVKDIQRVGGQTNQLRSDKPETQKISTDEDFSAAKESNEVKDNSNSGEYILKFEQQIDESNANVCNNLEYNNPSSVADTAKQSSFTDTNKYVQNQIIKHLKHMLLKHC